MKAMHDYFAGCFTLAHLPNIHFLWLCPCAHGSILKVIKSIRSNSVVYCVHHWSFTYLFCVLCNVISLKTNFLLLLVCSLHRPSEVCVCERQMRGSLYTTQLIIRLLNVFKLDHMSYLFNYSLYLFLTILHFLNGAHVYIVYSIQTFQIPSLDLRHLTFLYILNYVYGFIKKHFDLTLHYSTFLWEMHFLVLMCHLI